MSCGIYKITNTTNGKVYIGLSKNIERRWNDHKLPSTWKDKMSKTLYKAFVKYGLDSFTFEIIEECHSSILGEREIYWIEKYNSYNKGYNDTTGGEGAHGYKRKPSTIFNELVKFKPKNMVDAIVCDKKIFDNITVFRKYNLIQNMHLKEIIRDYDIEPYDVGNGDHLFMFLNSEIHKCKDLIDDIGCSFEEKDIDEVAYNKYMIDVECQLDFLKNELSKVELSDEFMEYLEIEESTKLISCRDDEYLFWDCYGDYDLAFGL